MRHRIKRWLSNNPGETNNPFTSEEEAANLKADRFAQTQDAIQSVTSDAGQSLLTSTSHSQSTGVENLESSQQYIHEAPYGLKELVSQPPDNKGAVDVVAIHGLNGEHIRDFASELLAAVKASRKHHAEKRRPIIFVCHSLGGLVFKQSVIRAHEQDRFYASILKNMLGVIFFATAHRGSDLAFWDRIGTRVVHAATLGLTTNVKLSKDLKVDSEMLKRISDSFVYRGGGFRIRSFYETGLMPRLNCRVVEKESATLVPRLEQRAQHRIVGKSFQHLQICFPRRSKVQDSHLCYP